MSGSKRQRVLHYLKAQLGLLTPAAGRFEKLPGELVELIATSMDRQTLCTFRTTCSYAARCTDYHFRREYLTIFRTDLSTGSLRRLQKRIQDAEYAKGIRTLVVEAAPGALKEHAKDDTFPVLGGYFKWLRGADGHVILEQDSVNKWCDAVKQLPECRSFRLVGELPALKGADYELLRPVDASRVILHFIKTLQIPVVSFDVGMAWLEEVMRVNNRRLNASEFLEDATFLEVWSSLKSYTINGSIPSFGHGLSAKMILAGKNLRQLTVGTEMVPRHVLRDLMAHAGSLALEQVCFDETNMTTSGADDARDFLLSQSKTLKRLVFEHAVCHVHWTSILGPMKNGRGFQALEEISFDHCYHWDTDPRLWRAIAVSGASRKTARGKYELTKFRWTYSSDSRDISFWTIRAPGGPKTVMELEELVDLSRW
ncbi:hypothetical protein BJY00DRAFT_311432 [Aspergillus carlsbadensis]|nr:hypothetical protein BJY00DRAFT_311432 [Aspergillus carlsbadensis]